MAANHLSVYLNDHLAGSVVALDLLGHLITTSTDVPSMTSLLSRLRDEIRADREELEQLMKGLQIAISSPRKAMGWLAEKGTQLKLWLDDSAHGPLRLLEALELVAVGIDGKRALWRSLAAASEINPLLRKADYQRLERRAQEQRDEIETVRLIAARMAFGDES